MRWKLLKRIRVWVSLLFFICTLLLFLDFTASLIGGDKLAVVVRVAKISRSTVTLEFDGLRKRADNNDLTPVFTATFIHCFYSNKLDSAIPIPEKQSTLLKDYAVAQKAKNNL